jgi:hypothetical protein
MILARVAYDAYNQQFRLADPELAVMFEDGEIYVLFVDFLPRQATPVDPDFDLETFAKPPVGLGHA